MTLILNISKILFNVLHSMSSLNDPVIKKYYILKTNIQTSPVRIYVT